MWVRGLKKAAEDDTTADTLSHPMWVRGLKLKLNRFKLLSFSRTLCGCVD